MKYLYCKTKNLQSGFTLIEVMISLLVFATGMLGVTFQMSQGIKNTINTEVHSSVMQVALQSIEPLKRSVLQDNTAFLAQLNDLNTNGTAPPFAGNSNQENFVISVESATDDGGAGNNNLFTKSTASWVPPFTVVLQISYDTGIQYSDTATTTLAYFTTHVLVPTVPG